MDRRNFLALSAAASIAGIPLAGCSDDGDWDLPERKAAEKQSGKRRIPWRNWSGYLESYPQLKAAPASVGELAELLKNAKGTVRPVGSSHSFQPLVPTDDTIVSLRNFQGLLDYDPEKLTATFGAGTKLGNVGDPLHEAGQALPNMPDVDAQTLAGAMATGTHGTSKHRGALHSYIEELELVTPQGEILSCSKSKNSDIFKAAQVSLGSLGIITKYKMQNVETTRLKRQAFMLDINDFYDGFDKLIEENHSVDSYYLPFCDRVLVVAINPTDDPINSREGDPDASAVDEMKALRDYLNGWPGLRRWLINKATADYPLEENVDWWHKVYPSERSVRFNEMEYHMDLSELIPTLKKVRETVETQFPEVFFPIEIRVVKGDNAWLSPFGGHETSASIAVHRFYKEDPKPYFAAIEPLFKAAGGRPHWGKMNTMQGYELEAAYPQWGEFKKIRQQLDPDGKMLNEYLGQIFG
ncbi:MAG: FAD-linked oxidoreductase [Gammaproteobacteria bacterium]|jgi:FAD-linked oxidoreductase